MSAIYFGGIFAVNGDRFVLRNVFVGEVNHHFFFFQLRLQFSNIHVGYAATVVDCQARRVRRRLRRQNSGRDYAQHVPTVPFGGRATPCRQHIRIILARKRAQRHFVQEIAVLKIVNRTY